MSVKLLSKKHIFFWMIQIAVPFAILFIPTNDLFTGQMRAFCAITLFAIIAFATEIINQTCISIILPIAYIVLGVCDASVAFSPWSNFVPWMCISGLFLVTVLNRIGLLNRLCYHLLVVTGCSYKGILSTLAVMGIILNLLMPGTAFIILGAVAFGICTSLKLGKSQASAGIMFGAMIAACFPTTLFLTSGQLIMYGIGNSGFEVPIPTYMGFFGTQAIGWLFYIVLFFVTAFIFKPEVSIAGKEFYQNALKEMGKISKNEIKTLALMFILLVLIVTEKYHGISAGWCFVVIPFLLLFPGVDVAEPTDINHVNIGLVLFIASCMSIGSAAAACGFANTIGTLSMPLIEGKSMTFVVAMIFIIGVIANFFMTPLSMFAAFAAPFTNIALELGINPGVLYQTLTLAGDQLLLPYESSFYLVIFSFGLMSMKDFAKGCGIKMVLSFIFLLCILLPYWHLIGFTSLI